MTQTDFDLFVPDFLATVDSGIGTNMDCRGDVNALDFMDFLSRLEVGVPGPSGLECAGEATCP